MVESHGAAHSDPPLRWERLHATRGRWWRLLRPSSFPDTRPSLLSAIGNDQPAPSAWREFFERYAPAVYRVALRYGLDAHDADDIVQQVMLSLSDRMNDFRYDRDRGRFRNWIKTVTSNRIRDLLRHRYARTMRQETVDLAGVSAEVVDPEQLWEQEWKLQDLHYCLDQVRQEIAPRRFEAFRLYVLEGVSAEDTGRQLGMSRAYVYVTRSQVVSRVRALMQQLAETEQGQVSEPDGKREP
jgi:RNA polymerase sigma-70 factor (ECF subfamily)